jgi:hypothetical protein
VRPTLLYISSKAVIPAKAGIQLRNTGFRVKPGMTIKVKGLLTQYISIMGILFELFNKGCIITQNGNGLQN